MSLPPELIDRLSDAAEIPIELAVRLATGDETGATERQVKAFTAQLEIVIAEIREQKKEAIKDLSDQEGVPVGVLTDLLCGLSILDDEPTSHRLIDLMVSKGLLEEESAHVLHHVATIQGESDRRSFPSLRKHVFPVPRNRLPHGEDSEWNGWLNRAAQMAAGELVDSPELEPEPESDVFTKADVARDVDLTERFVSIALDPNSIPAQNMDRRVRAYVVEAAFCLGVEVDNCLALAPGLGITLNWKDQVPDVRERSELELARQMGTPPGP